jgi:hypothetical protein
MLPSCYASLLECTALLANIVAEPYVSIIGACFQASCMNIVCEGHCAAKGPHHELDGVAWG